MAHLRDWVREEYLKHETIATLRSKFEEEACFHLHSFLREDRHAAIEAALRAQCAGAGGGEEGGWTVVGPPHKQRFEVFGGAGAGAGAGAGMGALLQRCLDGLFRADAFRRWLSTITGFDFTHAVGACRCVPARRPPETDAASVG